jgi:hypothetical protein
VQRDVLIRLPLPLEEDRHTVVPIGRKSIVGEADAEPHRFPAAVLAAVRGERCRAVPLIQLRADEVSDRLDPIPGEVAIARAEPPPPVSSVGGKHLPIDILHEDHRQASAVAGLVLGEHRARSHKDSSINNGRQAAPDLAASAGSSPSWKAGSYAKVRRLDDAFHGGFGGRASTVPTSNGKSASGVLQFTACAGGDARRRLPG